VFKGLQAAIVQDRYAFFKDFLNEFSNVDELGPERISPWAWDAEFAVAAGDPPANVHLLQCRPETVWSRRPRRALAGRRSALESVVSTLTKEHR
jgi:hypothetical protein